jgi:hypothetical protein
MLWLLLGFAVLYLGLWCIRSHADDIANDCGRRVIPPYWRAMGWGIGPDGRTKVMG